MSGDEERIIGLSFGSAVQTKRAKRALSQLTELAAESPRAADDAAELLESAVAVLTEQRVRTTMPKAEQAHWETLGATFEDPAAISRARLRSTSQYRRLVKDSIEGDTATAAYLGVDRSRVSQRVREQSLYMFTTGETRYFPRWQFDGNKTIPRLRQVLTALPDDLHPLSVQHWFTTPNGDLILGDDEPLSPRDWLITGGPAAAVVDLASNE